MSSAPVSQHPSEAEKLHSVLFAGHIPSVLAERFGPASERLNSASAASELVAYYRAIETTSDLEALEFAARLSGRLPLLTRKILLMAYLAETLPDYQGYYVDCGSGFVRAAGEIALQTVRSIYKALKGYWLLRRIRGNA